MLALACGGVRICADPNTHRQRGELQKGVNARVSPCQGHGPWRVIGHLVTKPLRLIGREGFPQQQHRFPARTCKQLEIEAVSTDSPTNHRPRQISRKNISSTCRKYVHRSFELVQSYWVLCIFILPLTFYGNVEVNRVGL